MQSHRADLRLVLLDTSVCVDVLRASDCEAADTARMLLIEQRSAICDPVLMELRQGCRSSRQRDAVEELSHSCRHLALDVDDWVKAGDARASDLRKGLTFSQFDYLISAIAISHSVPLLTTDSDYKRISIKPELLQFMR